jgi:hypothetical protein
MVYRELANTRSAWDNFRDGAYALGKGISDIGEAVSAAGGGGGMGGAGGAGGAGAAGGGAMSASGIAKSYQKGGAVGVAMDYGKQIITGFESDERKSWEE